jgi:peptidoglycan/LPS O-acetylase OafA/YrhL
MAIAVGARRFEALDSLRGLAACMVVLYHSNTTGVIMGMPLVQNSWLFVDFFFVLSGFVISASFGRRLRDGLSLTTYFGRRVGRLWPLNAFVLGLFLAVELAKLAVPGAADHPAFAPPNTLQNFVTQLFFAQMFQPDQVLGWNFPDWSIAVEIWSYLAFALIWRFGGRWHWFCTAALIAASCIILATSGGLHHRDIAAVCRGLFGFGLGACAYEAWRAGWKFRGTAWEFAALLAIVAYVSFCGEGPASVAAPVIFTLAIVVFSREEGALSAVLRTRPMRALGAMSYSIYLLHLFMIQRVFDVAAALERALGRTWIARDSLGQPSLVLPAPCGDLVTVATLALIILSSALTYRFVERPSRAWSRRRFSLTPDPIVAAVKA